MVSEAVLGIVVGADFFAAVTRADLELALAGGLFELLAHHRLVDPCLEDLHRFVPVFVLRFLILDRHDDPGRQVGQTDGGIGGVDALAAAAAGAVDIHFDLVGLDVEFHILHFGDDSDGDGGGVDASLGFGGGDPLDPVGAGFVFELAVDSVPFDQDDELLVPPGAPFGGADDLHLPPLAFGEAQIHSKHIFDKKSALVSAGSRAKLQIDVFVVVGVFGDHQDFDCLLQLRKLRLQLRQLLLGQFAKLRIGEHRFVLFDGVADLQILPGFFHQRGDGGLFLAQFRHSLDIRSDLGRAEQPVDLFVTVDKGLEFLFEHFRSSNWDCFEIELCDYRENSGGSRKRVFEKKEGRA